LISSMEREKEIGRDLYLIILPQDHCHVSAHQLSCLHMPFKQEDERGVSTTLTQDSS